MRSKTAVTDKGLKIFAGFFLGIVFLTQAFAQSIPHNAQNPADTPDRAFRGAARVNPTTLKMSFDIPFMTYTGRGGTSLPVNVSYNSSVWRMEYGGYYQGGPVGLPDDDNFAWVSTHYGDYDNTVGWSSSLGFPSAVWGGTCEHYDMGMGTGIGCETSGYYFYVKRFRMRMPDGSSHEFRVDDRLHSGPPSGGPVYPITFYSVDGSNLRYVEHSSTGWTLYLPDGSRYVSDGGQYFIDPDGNKMILTSGGWTDMLGRTIAAPNLVPPSQPGDVNYSVPSLDGGTQTYIFRWRLLKNTATGESVLTDPAQPLKLVGDTFPVPRGQYYGPSLFQSESGTKVTPPGEANPIVISEIVSPNGAKYKFTYNIYGEIDKILYPTGAYERFRYAPVEAVEPQNAPYSQINRGVVERWVSQSGNAADEQRWQYSTSAVPGNYSPYLNPLTVTTTAPDGTSTTNIVNRGRSDASMRYGFDDSRAGMTKEIQVRGAGGQLLRRTLTEWAQSGPLPQPYSYSHATRDPRAVKAVEILFEGDQALAKTTTYSHDQYLNVISTTEHDFVAGDRAWGESLSTATTPFGTALRTTETTYVTDPGYTGRQMMSLPQTTVVRQGGPAGPVVAKTQFFYDEPGYAPLTYGGTVTGWQDPNTAYRGQVTTTRSWSDVTANQYIDTHTQYDQFGNPRKSWDGRGNMSETQYADNYSDGVNRYTYALPTRTISPDPDGAGPVTPLEATVKYDFGTGLPTAATDANNQTTTIEYNDPLLRPTKVTAPNGHQTITEYGAGMSAATRWVRARSQIDGTNWKEGYTWFDGLGRTVRTQSVDNAGDVFALTCYDNMGRVAKATNPFRNWTATQDCSTPNGTSGVHWTANTYDAAGRPWKATTPDGAVVETTYSLATSGGQIGTVVTVEDQADKPRRSVTNALGQLVRVDEPNASNQLGTIDNPNQWTGYSYDLLNNLTTVTQGVQTRTFAYDALSRLKSATNPESGTINYSYDANGNLTAKVDARSITTAYAYDALNRVKTRTYSGETGYTTPDVSYFYDNVANAKGRLTKVSSSVSTTEYTSFDILGRVTAHKQTTDGQNYTTGYTYNLSGALIEETYPSGRVVKNTLDTDGSLSQVQSKKASDTFRNYANGFNYTAAGAVASMRLGNGLWETTIFNSRLQPTQIALGSGSAMPNKLKLDYSYGDWNGTSIDATKNSGNVVRQIITVPTVGASTGFTATQKYYYDSLNRIDDATEEITGQTWRQDFTYDRYGNRRFNTANTTTLPSGCAEAACNPQINPTNNRLIGYQFDTAGNTTIDAENRTITYDAENKQVRVQSGVTLIGEYFYDGDGKRIKKVVPNGETTVFVYDASGKLVAEYSTIVEPQATAKTSYLTSDHLGSPRINTDAVGNVTARHDYRPFGEEIVRASYGGDGVRKKFTGYERDNESELDFAQARYYNPAHGRFTTVDPLAASASLSDPQTFNRYIYVRNSPLVMVDPTGMIGDYYSYDGRYLGHDGIDDQKVYFASLIEDRGAEVDLDRRTIRETTIEEVFKAQDRAVGITPGTSDPIGELVDSVAENAETKGRTVRMAGTVAGVAGACVGTAGAGCAGAVRLGTAIIEAEMEAANAGAENTNPFAGPVTHPVTIVDSDGNAIRVETNQQAGGSPNGDFIQVKDAQGNPTGLRKDGPHNPRSHPDPRAQKPHAHVPGVKNPDGTPWIKIKKR